jgi:uncharacterized protein (DUF924 family)
MQQAMSLEAEGRAREVLEFWFGDWREPRAREVWFRKDPAFDEQIRARFGDTVELALRGEPQGPLSAWASRPAGALAELLLLDQFTRNIFRDTPRAFAGDARALELARQVVARGWDQGFHPVARAFVYLPFEHAEDLAAQDESIRLFTALAAEHPPSAETLAWAHKHRAVILRFGRYPHRNALLGRVSSAEEEAFLAEPGSRF